MHKQMCLHYKEEFFFLPFSENSSECLAWKTKETPLDLTLRTLWYVIKHLTIFSVFLFILTNKIFLYTCEFRPVNFRCWWHFFFKIHLKFGERKKRRRELRLATKKKPGFYYLWLFIVYTIMCKSDVNIRISSSLLWNVSSFFHLVIYAYW